MQRAITCPKRKRSAQVRCFSSVQEERLTLGPAELRDGHIGTVTRLYNNGQFGLFQPNNGSPFTITAGDTKACSDPTLEDIFATLREVQAICLTK
jgi:hypothetical protein